MTQALIQLSEDEFDDQYPLIPNPFNPTAGWSYGDGPGCLFETYGDELEFVRKQDPANVWTLLDGDDGELSLASGFHLVNRIGYLISNVLVPPDVGIEVRIPMSHESETEPEDRVATSSEADPRLATIAEESLGIPTLQTRNSDSLDFYTVAVWAVRTALETAFEAGARSVRGKSETEQGVPTRFDDYEIQPCRRFAEDGDRVRFDYEACAPDEADVWTLYGHVPGQGVEAIGDFDTREQALEVIARITGRRYERNA